MFTTKDLAETLHKIDGKGYKAYKSLKGSYRFPQFVLYIDHVQGDPFAAPTKIRIRVSQTEAQIPTALLSSAERRLGVADALIRLVDKNIKHFARLHRGTGKSGLIKIDVGGQEILPRTALKLTHSFVEARLEIGLPAQGRTILSKQAHEMFFSELPTIIQHALFYQNLPQTFVVEFAHYVENYFAIQKQLAEKNLVAFIANGAILPRESGISQKPMTARYATPFIAPPELKIQLRIPNPINGQHFITGCGIPEGITLIVGGGFHGKSTLLRALELGIYPHLPGDGREYVVTLPEAVKIRAEDGRRIEKVDLRPFINHLPQNKDAQQFSTEDASGSTSQAANILEAIEVGAKLLLLDEDTCATNFMIRDARMQKLVHKKFEPITPFLDRVQELLEKFKISTILVMGGSGDYFQVATTVILMKDYLPYVVTEQARKIAQQMPVQRAFEREFDWQKITKRCPLPNNLNPSRGKKEIKIEAKSLHSILFGKHQIDLHSIEQIVDVSQTRAIGFALYKIRKWMDGQRTLSELMNLLNDFLQNEGLDALNPFNNSEAHPGNLALPRTFEIAAALNRFRALQVVQKKV